ncbi:peptide/nickel transport system substrate-binding protein [Azospirillum agricola]|uniref:ABC transporter substrate-binding protein n=1 Tax=Azospirillum agricola TaxID=1720247 RepID=UPI001AE38A5F|nr:ABC transporter substrate-binding protein [Azospirillum agricola]MBP2231947.1 peptide/nickel transport system substrate-binding protein [Azospirillum agricola]
MWHDLKRHFAGPLIAAAVVGLGAAGAHAAPRQGGTLTWIVTPEPASLIPLTNTAGGNAEIGPKVVEGLLTYDTDLNPKPLLATAWEVAKDGLQYRFSLRPGVKWHDGKDFTSADVAFSILTLKQSHPRGRSTFANVVEVRTPDPLTAVIVLSKPAPYLLTALAGAESPIVPKHLYEGTHVAANPRNSAPVGTGPFVFKEFVKGSHVVLERNPDYWDKGKPHLDKVIVRFIPDAVARAAALESGTAQLGGQAIPLSDVKRFSELPDLRVDSVNWAYVSNHQQLIFNLDTPILQNKAVRKAISQAIDVNALNKVVWYGYGTVSPAAIGKANTKYHNAGIQYFPVDTKQAEAALDAAGLKRGADGTRFKLRLLFNPFQERRAADFVRQSLARIGVDAVIESYDFATYTTKAYTERAFDITLEALANVFDPTVGVQRVFWSKNFKIGLPFSNAAHYANPEVDRLLEAASVEVDEAKRKALFLEFQQIVHDDVPSVEFGANPSITIRSKAVQNYAPTGEGLRGSFADLSLEP